MTAAAEASGCINMVGFNYIRTPASQFARRLIDTDAIGPITWFRDGLEVNRIIEAAHASGAWVDL